MPISATDMDSGESNRQQEETHDLTALSVHASILDGDASEILIPEDILFGATGSSLSANCFTGAPKLDSNWEGKLVFPEQSQQQTQSPKNTHQQQQCHKEQEGEEEEEQRLSIRMEHDVGDIHLYTKDNTTKLDSFVYTGSTRTSCRLSVVLQPTTNTRTTEIKDLGKKARARLDEERSKRREIVRLDNLPPPPSTASKRKQFLPLTHNKTSQDGVLGPSKKAKKPAVKRRPPHFKSSSTSLSLSSRGIDTWMEDVSHLIVDDGYYAKDRTTSSNSRRSTVVRVHGIPVGCTAEQIRRYFAGLEPERIFMVPTNDMNITTLDGISAARRRRTATGGHHPPVVERYPTTFRVFVKFASSPAASLATERSGEPIMLQPPKQQQQDDHDHDGGSSSAKGATIAVTQLNKSLASVLLATMAIDAVPGVPLDTTLSKVEAQLHPVVSKMLWVVAAHRWDNYSLQKELRRRTGLLANTERWDPLTLSGYQELARHYNKLVQLQDDLLYQHPFPGTIRMNPTTTAYLRAETNLERYDPVLRLTSMASQLLGEELDRIERLLYQARVMKNQQQQQSDSKRLGTITTKNNIPEIHTNDEEEKELNDFGF